MQTESASRAFSRSLLVLASILFASCADDGAAGAAGKDGKDLNPPIGRADALPGFNLQIVRVEGGSGANGNFVAGDVPRITFTAQEGEQGSTTAGDAIPSTAWSFQEAILAGPSSNYQQILTTRAISDNSVQNADGSWTFTWPAAIPASVPTQINQANTIPYDSGAIDGDALPDGTYTIGLSMRQDFTIEGRTVRDATSVVTDVLVGNATTVTVPELVTDANCAQCHTEVRAHGENRYGVRYCVLCHTNGSEDLNDPNANAGETLGLSISFQTMIHKIHSGAHLPSVNGKTVDTNGNPVYGTGSPYVIVRSRGEFDFSHVVFPQWPHLVRGMPRDIGYGSLSSSQQSAENSILSGPTNCAACHGDPDGSGPLPAPANGDAIFTNEISTRACIACHDDWDPTKPYAANGQTMPANLGDDTCTACHGTNPSNPGAAIDVRKAHTHPLLDTNNPPLWGAGAGAVGLQFNITAVDDIGDGDGVVETGEKIRVSMNVVDDDGAAVAPGDLARMELLMNGPTSNPNLVYTQTFSGSKAPSLLLTGSGPSHTFTLPDFVEYEIPTANSSTEFQTALAPHYPTQFGSNFATVVYTVPTGGSATTTLAAAAVPYQNYIDVASIGSIAAGDVIVVDEGNAAAEYLEVRAVEGTRVWFEAPLDTSGIRLTKAHALGAQVVEVTLTMRSSPGDYTLNATTGTVTFGSAPTDRVLVSYMTDFVVPAKYRGSINNSPSTDPNAFPLDGRIGEWTGMNLVAGTYRIGIYGEVGFNVDVTNGPTTESTSYTEGAAGDTVFAFRVGTAGDLDSYSLISSADNCYKCHRDLQFHGSHRRGFDNCLMCHATSGAEDWPSFKGGSGPHPETPGVSIEFREMIHKIHRGKELAAGEDYVVSGFFGRTHSYEEVGFPSFLGGTANCAACHGDNNEAWFAPTERVHPDQSSLTPQLVWRMTCGSCHDDRAAQAHIRTNSVDGLEGCAVCHGEGKELSVEAVHKNYRR